MNSCTIITTVVKQKRLSEQELDNRDPVCVWGGSQVGLKSGLKKRIWRALSRCCTWELGLGLGLGLGLVAEAVRKAAVTLALTTAGA